MDFRAIALPIGRLLIVVAVFMLVPAAADLYVGNRNWEVFLTSALVVGCFGGLATAAFYRYDARLGRRETFMFVNVAWIAFSIAGALPLYASDLNITFGGAFFEAASGLTTTGSTVLVGLDHMAPGVLLWRSILQWIGGLGIVVIGILLLPGLRVGGSQLFALESSEKANKPYGRIEPFVFRLLWFYLFLSVSCALLYYLAGMTAFQAICHSMTTVSTGGYSTSDSSMGQFHSLPLLWISIVYMMLASMPFLFLIRLIERGDTSHSQQVTFFIWFTLAASFLVFLGHQSEPGKTPFELFTLATFHVVSVLSTTGYAATDYLKWGTYVTAMMFILTFFGACSGSTAGGFKMFRVIIVWNSLVTYLKRTIYPNRIIEPRFSGATVAPEVLEGVAIFSVLYAGSFAIFAVIYACLGMDLATSLSGSITALANVGPGVGPIIGPSGTFHDVPEAAKWLLGIEMILGRLELIGGILVLSPDYWRET